MPGAGVDGRDGRVVDDRSPTMLLHVPRRALGPHNDPEEVHVHDPGEVLEIVRQEALQRAADPGIVEHDVEAAKALDREVDQRLDLSASLTSVCMKAAASPMPSASPCPPRRRRRRSRRAPLRPRAVRRSPSRCRPRHRSPPPLSLPTLALHATTLRSRSKCCSVLPLRGPPTDDGDDAMSSDHPQRRTLGVPPRSPSPTASPKSATTTPPSTPSRPSGSGPGSGRWRVASKRSPVPATTSSTRSWTAPWWWCATSRVRSGAFENSVATAGSRWSKAPGRSSPASPAPSTAGATASTGSTPSSRGRARSQRPTSRRAPSTWSRCAARSGAALRGSTSTPAPRPCESASSPSPPSWTSGRSPPCTPSGGTPSPSRSTGSWPKRPSSEQYHVIETHPELVIPKRSAPKDPAAFDAAAFVDAELHYLHVMSEGMAGMVHANDVAVAEGRRTVALPETPKRPWRAGTGASTTPWWPGTPRAGRTCPTSTTWWSGASARP